MVHNELLFFAFNIIFIVLINWNRLWIWQTVSSNDYLFLFLEYAAFLAFDEAAAVFADLVLMLLVFLVVLAFVQYKRF